MFTGLIEDLGIVKYCSGGKLSIQTKLKDIKIGDSININGVCLTVTQIASAGAESLLFFDLLSETRKKSLLEGLKAGERVNLERAVQLGQRLGGHLVTGHVDGVGMIKKKTTQRDGILLEVNCPQDLLEYIVPKGSLALEGVSLTVISVNSGRKTFSLGIIPHTQKTTTLGFKRAGDKVNLEVDILSKYIRFDRKDFSSEKITEAFLRQKGML